MFQYIRYIFFIYMLIFHIAYSIVSDKFLQQYEEFKTFRGNAWIFNVDTITKDNLVYNKITKKELTGKVILFYPNSNKLQAVMDYVNGIKNGMYYEYYENGKLAIEVPYKNGKQEGNEKQYYTNGRLKSYVLYKDGKKEGDIFIYHDSSAQIIKEKSNYLNNMIHGSWLTYNIHGKLLSKEYYYEGMKHEKQIFYDESGHITDENEYYYDTLIKRITYYHKTMTIKDDFEWYENDSYIWNSYNENGYLMISGEAKLSQYVIKEKDRSGEYFQTIYQSAMHGFVAGYYPSGQLKYEVQMENGILAGQFVQITEAEERVFEGFGKDNIFHSFNYYINGKLAVSCGDFSNNIYKSCLFYQENTSIEIENQSYQAISSYLPIIDWSFFQQKDIRRRNEYKFITQYAIT